MRALVVAFILFLAGYSFYYAQTSPQFEVKKIHYEGIVHVDRQALEKLIQAAFSKNLLLIDLDRLRGLVESEPWVKEARVRRKLPDQLFIYIKEREAAAVATIDSELYLVDPEGVVLDRYGRRYGSIDKPVVKGLKNVARENAREENAHRMATYLKVLNDLDSTPIKYSKSISEVNVEETERVAVVPSDEPVPVYLGNEKFLRRYQIFLSKKDVYRQLKEQYGSIESVDVSYENRIIFHTPKERSEDGQKEVVVGRD